jgi:hypothetical protein
MNDGNVFLMQDTVTDIPLSGSDEVQVFKILEFFDMKISFSHHIQILTWLLTFIVIYFFTIFLNEIMLLLILAP